MHIIACKLNFGIWDTYQTYEQKCNYKPEPPYNKRGRKFLFICLLKKGQKMQSKEMKCIQPQRTIFGYFAVKEPRIIPTHCAHFSYLVVLRRVFDNACPNELLRLDYGYPTPHLRFQVLLSAFQSLVYIRA